MQTTRTTTIRRHRLLLVAVAVAAGTLGAACGGDSDDAARRGGWVDADRVGAEEEGDEATEVTVADDAASSEGAGGATSQGTQPGGSGGGSTGGSAGGGGSTGGTGGGQAPATPAPVIVSFTTPESIDCHNGSFQTFTASWSTTGATKVTISIDGPGIYDTYGPAGETSLPFSCSSHHTFLLTAYGPDGQTATKQVTLHPRNVQPEAPEDEAAA